MTLQENDLVFNFEGAIDEIRFDDGAHGSSDSIQPVDFLIEFDDHYRFIEVKDPDCPNPANVESFRQKLNSGILIRKLAGKYRDTFFSFSFQQKAQKKIQYIVVLAMSELTPAQLLTRTGQLQKEIPIRHSNWKEDAAVACGIFNLNQYLERFGNGSVMRISEGQEDSVE